MNKSLFQLLVKNVLAEKKSWPGKKSDWYATVITRKLFQDIKEFIHGPGMMRGQMFYDYDEYDIPVIEEIPTVCRITMRVRVVTAPPNTYFKISGSMSDLINKISGQPVSGAGNIAIMVSVTDEIPDDVLPRIHADMKATLRHEIEHSFQALDVRESSPGSSIETWRVKDVEDYFTNEAEVKAFVAGIYKQAKSTHIPALKLLNNVIAKYRTSLSSMPTAEKLTQNDVNRIMDRTHELWRYYLLSRYPDAQEE